MAHTTLSIDKTIYNKSSKKAKKQHLSVSAVASMLLEAYAKGKIDIMPVYADPPVELREIPDHEITPSLRKKAKRAYHSKPSELFNI